MKSRAGAILNAGGVPICDRGGEEAAPRAALSRFRSDPRRVLQREDPIELVTSRTDATVNFDWGIGRRRPASVTTIFPFDGRARSSAVHGSDDFYTQSDDGVRLG
jgi:hypothetical protein